MHFLQAFSNGLVLLLDSTKEDASGKMLAASSPAAGAASADAFPDSSSFSVFRSRCPRDYSLWRVRECLE
jgi:hypothetical protein